MKKVLKIAGAVVLGLMLLAILIGACSDPAVEEKEPAKEVVVKEKPVKEAEPKKEAPKKVEPVKPAVDPLEPTKAEEAVLADFRANFPDSSVTFHKESKIYKIVLKGDGFVNDLAGMVNGTVSKDSWYGLVDATVSASNKLKAELGTGYSITLTNPANEENVILLVTDGVVLYDIFAK